MCCCSVCVGGGVLVFLYTCADPETFARGGPAVTIILVDEGGEDPKTTKSEPSISRQRNAI